MTVDPRSSSETLAEITGFRKGHGGLSKRLYLRDGKVCNDSSGCRMAQGTAYRIKIAHIQQLADWINGFSRREALSLGRLKTGLQDSVAVVVKSKLNGAARTIARTRDYVEFQIGAEGIALLDTDLKGTPDEVAHRVKECDGVWGALTKVLPELVGTARVERPSTSSCLRNTETGETYPSSGGRHIYIAVRDAADISRFLSDLHDRLWLAGFGFGIVSRAGSFLERSLIDVSVGSSERLIFEAHPTLIHRLSRTCRRARRLRMRAACSTHCCASRSPRQKRPRWRSSKSPSVSAWRLRWRECVKSYPVNFTEINPRATLRRHPAA